MTCTPVKIEIAVLTSVVILFSAGAFCRNMVWRNDLSLWSDVVEKSSQKARPHNYLGIALQKNGETDKAAGEYARAIEISPGYPYAYVNLGICYFEKGDVKAAVKAFERAIAISPNHADAHYNLGIAYGSIGRYQDAYREIRLARAISSRGKWNLIRREMKKR